jgi:hypothetical protein
VEQGEKLSRVLLHSIGILNFDINLGRAAFGEISVLTWRGVTLGWNFYINIWRAACEAYGEFWYQPSICSRAEENHGKL